MAGGTTKIFHYDLWGYLIAETNQSGQMLAEYIYLGDQLLAMIKPGELVYYYHNDHLGTPQVLTDATGSIAWKATYDPFGEATISVQAVENPFRFPGQYYDQETGLHYNYYRYYNPPIGRYITPDPIGLKGGINLFSYVMNNPINAADPEGLDMSWWDKIKIAKKAKGIIECAVSLYECASKIKECKEKIKPCEDNIHDPIFKGDSVTQFRECWQKSPECQKALKSCGAVPLPGIVW